MRETVSAKQLLDVLNLRLAAAGVPETCQFCEPIVRLRRPDTSGCNWSRSVMLSSGVHSPLHYLGAAEQTLLSVSQQYNI